MGGRSYSYTDYDKTSNSGKFYGTATDKGDTWAGGGFSIVSKNGDYSYDLSEYTGLAVEVAS